MAEWHRLSGLLRRYLHAQDEMVDVPAVVAEALRDSVQQITMRNLQRQAELRTVLEALAEADIPAMLLKGAALLEAVYPEVGLRPMADLDILVPRGAIHRAQAAVQLLGYDTVGGRIDVDADDKLLRHHHHFPLMKDGSVFIELHHHVLFDAPASFDISGYWARAVPGREPVPHLLPSPEDLFLHIAVHFTQDRISRGDAALGQLADLAWTAGRHELDWDALSARARAYGVGDWLFLALHAAQTLFGDVAPQRALDGLQPPSFRADLGAQFIRQRVLDSRPSLPLEQLSRTPRALLFPTRSMLDAYVQPGEEATPSLMRLRARRAGVLLRRAVRAAPWRRPLIADVRLSRWLLTLDQ
jgi:hypothetical protein